MTRVHIVDDRHVAVIEPHPTGFGPTVWVGELRTLDDRPVVAYAHDFHYIESHGGTSLQRAYPVSTGATEAAVLAALIRRAASMRGAV